MGLLGAPEKDRETRHQLGWFKRLGEMVVRTGFEGLQFILQGGLGGQHRIGVWVKSGSRRS